VTPYMGQMRARAMGMPRRSLSLAGLVLRELKGEMAVPARHHPWARDVGAQSDACQVGQASDGCSESRSQPERVPGCTEHHLARSQLAFVPVVNWLCV
jgi:hypothetical protein